MDGRMTGCGCNETDCWTMPFEFVRLRYFHGQRIGVMELTDQAAYHAGKHAFHNARLHGVGVLCGLRVERYTFTPGAHTTLLRVRRGAALDACGREVIVGADQCIDVAAWVARHRQRIEVPSSPLEHRPVRLWVALRYRECPTDPAPAPRDPCGGCDTGGCEYGRVREGFELQILTDAERHLFQSAPLLAGGEIQALAEDNRADWVSRVVHDIVSGDCTEATDGGWLCLASFEVTFRADQSVERRGVEDISIPDNTVEERRSLLSTAALQAIVQNIAVSGSDLRDTSEGPRILGVRYDPPAVASPLESGGAVVLVLRLGRGGLGGAGEVDLVATTVGDKVQVHRLDTRLGATSAWQVVSDPAVYDPVRREIRVPLRETPDGGVWHRVTVQASLEAPVVDEHARPLCEHGFAQRFQFVGPDEHRTLQPAL